MRNIFDKFVEAGQYIDDHKQAICCGVMAVGVVMIGCKIYQTGFSKGCLHGAKRTWDVVGEACRDPAKLARIAEIGELAVTF